MKTFEWWDSMLFKIKKFRNERHLTLKQLSKRSGYSYGYLDKLENNTKNFTFDALEEIGHALEICPIQLIAGCYEQYCTKDCYYYYERYCYDDLPEQARNEIKDFISHIKLKYK